MVLRRHTPFQWEFGGPNRGFLRFFSDTSHRSSFVSSWRERKDLIGGRWLPRQPARQPARWDANQSMVFTHPSRGKRAKEHRLGAAWRWDLPLDSSDFNELLLSLQLAEMRQRDKVLRRTGKKGQPIMKTTEQIVSSCFFFCSCPFGTLKRLFSDQRGRFGGNAVSIRGL